MFRLVSYSAAVALAATPVAVSGQKPIPLGRPDAEFIEPFTQVAGVRELRDGRVLVTDPREKIVLLIDLKSGTARKIGREGSGPGEYILPQRIVALRGDTSAIYDPSNVRYLLIGPDGKTGPNFYLEDATTGGRGRPGGTTAKGSDARGRIFYEGSQFTITPDGMAPADSTPVLRYDRLTRRSDTVAYVHLAKGNAQVSGGTGMVRMQVGQRAFPSRDEWAALPDGGVAVVRVRDYHVDRYSAAGKRTSGAPVRVEAIPVTEADKEEVRAERRAIAVSGPQLGRGGTPPRGAPPTRSPREPEFPAFKPPFVLGGVFARPNGELWVLRSRKAGDKVPVYDVFNAVGTLTVRVTFPLKTRLVGFGNGTVYVVRVDDDDLQYLQRYRFP
jgi:hypothetical protein